MEDNSLLNVKNVPALMAVYLFDETDIKKYIQQLHDERIVVGLIYIDNYDEALESIDELRRSLLAGLVERKISKYITNGNGIVKKLEKDKYLWYSIISTLKSLGWISFLFLRRSGQQISEIRWRLR